MSGHRTRRADAFPALERPNPWLSPSRSTTGERIPSRPVLDAPRKGNCLEWPLPCQPLPDHRQDVSLGQGTGSIRQPEEHLRLEPLPSQIGCQLRLDRLDVQASPVGHSRRIPQGIGKRFAPMELGLVPNKIGEVFIKGHSFGRPAVVGAKHMSNPGSAGLHSLEIRLRTGRGQNGQREQVRPEMIRGLKFWRHEGHGRLARKAREFSRRRIVSDRHGAALSLTLRT